MEHRDGRRVPIAAQQVRDPAGEPIVAVDDIVADAVAQGEEGHLGGEGREDVEERALVDRGGRAGADVDHAHVLVGRHHVGQVGIGPARKNIDRDTQATELPAEFADVDVEAPGVLLPEPRQRGGVDADHRHAAYIAEITGAPSVVHDHDRLPPLLRLPSSIAPRGAATGHPG